MTYFFKKFLLLWLLLFTNLMYADGTNISISIANGTAVNENDGTATFTVSLSEEADWCDAVSINYNTANGSAKVDSDYNDKNGTLTFYGACDAPSRVASNLSQTVSVTVLDDTVYELREYFYLNISNNTTGYNITRSRAYVYINDNDDGLQVKISSSDVQEGNIGDRNQMEFKIFLNKDYPLATDLSINYTTQSGSNPSATVSSDYTETSGSVIFSLNDREKIVYVPIIGDNNIEPNENLKMMITGSYVFSSQSTSQSKILNDDGSYPALTFDVTSFPSRELIEGDSGQKNLNFTLQLDKPALAGSSFEYRTEDASAKILDNDYIEIPSTPHVFVGGERNVTISVKIQGDTNIEPNEEFYLKIFNASDDIKLSSSVIKSKGIILNDDGEFTKVSIEAPILSFIEKDSNKTAVKFNIKLDAPATENNVSVEYLTLDASAKSSDNDYNAIPPTTVIFNIGEQEKSFIAYINGDTKVENNESFSIKLQNPQHLSLAKDNITIKIINDDEHSGQPFICDSSMYISSSSNRETGATGKMWLHQIDTTQNPFNFQVIEENGATELYNATAYNPDDNYIYGLYHRELIKLSSTGKVINLGKILGLPKRFDNKQLYAGAIYGGYYYVTGRKNKQKALFKIALSDFTVSNITLSKSVAIQDFSFSYDGKYLYGVDKKGKLTKIDVADGNVTQKGIAHTGHEFDSTFSDKNGRFFANDSNGGGFFEFDLNTGDKRFLSASQPATYNDGANCLNAALVFSDYGDAPSSYGTARHDINNGIFMGSEVDHDINPFYSLDANGDDSNGIDDEDGVTLINGADINGTYFKVNATQELKVTVSKYGFLNVWLDFGIDGTFNTAGDQVLTAKALKAGTHTISFNVPAHAITNQQTYIRFRFSSTPTLDATQNASDGEVEDYAIKFGTLFKGIKGRFNIQRTNSALNAKDYALYTQIVGRDFNYHVVFYDENMTQEEELINVPLKIELIDANDLSNAAALYTSYKYFSHSSPKSRISVLDNADLDALPAVKEALFKITYAIDENGAILQQECTANYQNCFETLMASSTANRTNEAKDKFAIRPESFFISIADANVEGINSQYPNTTLRLAAGYDYNLTFLATQWNNQLPAKGYKENFTTSFDFNSSGMTSCADTTAIEHNITFVDGQYNDVNFSHDNVGRYTVTIQDDENWTAIDKSEGDCLIGKHFTSSDGDSKSGCNIKLQIHDINLEFQPYQFDVNLNMNNLPSSTHDDFIYMMELNATNNNVAIQFEGNITAQGEDNTTTSNFTAGCVATPLLLDLNASSISVEGINQQILTIDGTNVDFSRIIRFNDETNPANFDVNKSIIKIGNIISIDSSKFLNDNNGTMSLDMRYNLNKHLSESINPVEVTFNSIEVNASDANSSAHGILNYIPSGKKDFTSNVKNFYFARVVSAKNNYPRVNMNVSPLVRTPLNVDIYCDINLTYCTDRKVLDNSNLTATTREQIGWYLSSKHNAEVDGNVTALISSSTTVTLTPHPTLPAGADDITLTKGVTGTPNVEFDNCTVPVVTITIETSPVLAFTPSEYTVNCTDNNASQWTGIGKTGNVLSVTPKVGKSGKMDW